MNKKEEDTWNKAQEGEINWWIHHHKKHLNIKNRDWYLGYRHKNWREVMHRFGLTKGHALNLESFQAPILDLGSGMVSMLEGINLEVHALEPTLEKLRIEFPHIVRIGIMDNTRYICGQIYDLQSDFYNTVWCNNVLDHTPDWREILTREIPRVIKKGGTLMLAVDVRKSNNTADYMHMGAFTSEQLSVLLTFESKFKCVYVCPAQSDDKYRWYYIGKKQ